MRPQLLTKKQVVSFFQDFDPLEATTVGHKAAHVLRLHKADVLPLKKAHVLRLNTEICPVFTSNTKETTKGGPHFVERPKAASFVLAVNTGPFSVLRRKACAFVPC